MTDGRLDALLRSIDVPVTPSPDFTSASLEALRPRARAARRRDATALGRAWRNVQALRFSAAGLWWRDRPAAVLLLALLLLALLAVGAVIVGSLQRQAPIRNGVLVIALAGEIRTFDIEDGTSRRLDWLGTGNHRVSRSPDGRTIAYWHPSPDGATDELLASDLAGGSPRRLAADLAMGAGGCVDAWSPDSSRLASEVVVGGQSRILVVDIARGTARLVTDPSVEAACPIWAPDDVRLAFHVNLPDDRSGIAVLEPGASEPRVVTGDMGTLEVDGPDTWSPDGRWIYFGAENSVWRTDVDLGKSFLLRPSGVAPIVSPDGSRLSYTVMGSDYDLYIANADGSDAHLLLAFARNNGWTADGRFIIARWMPRAGGGGVVRVTPEGKVDVIAPIAESCPDHDVGCDMGWGMPKP